MARPTKQGLDYFPLDTELDENIQLIEAEFGVKGFAVIVKIYSKIYKYYGYYGDFSPKKTLLFAKETGLKTSFVNEVISRALEYNIFNKDLFDKFQILTSRGVQVRYLTIVSRRTNVHLKNEFLLIPRDTIPSGFIVDINGVNAYINGDTISTNDTKESKENKIKENESKVNEKIENKTIDIASQSVQSQSVDYMQILELFNSKCKSLPKATQLTDKRKRFINSALRSNVDFTKLFEKVEKSDFLSGRNGKWTGCSFDWVLEISNRTKIIEGNYDNRKTSSNVFCNNHPSYDIQELEKIV